jgi:hypothetical protein
MKMLNSGISSALQKKKKKKKEMLYSMFIVIPSVDQQTTSTFQGEYVPDSVISHYK